MAGPVFRMNSLDTELDTWSRKYQAGLRAARLRDEAITFEVLILIHHGEAIATLGTRTRTPHP
jgi:hypothetical protein